MTKKEDDLRSLLKAAEHRIEEVVQENQSLSRAYHDMMEGQKLEVEQMVRLTEQLWVLEEALAKTGQEKQEVLDALSSLKSRFELLRAQATHTLEAASANASRLELAARVYEMAKTAEMDELDKRLAAYNAGLKR
jgi:predicted nucleotide-binding protein (sugar kinase/HSP70/actin superfamily)